MSARTATLGLVFLAACVETRGTAWMAQPLGPPEEPPPRGAPDDPARHRVASAPNAGRPLGTFRNTYYDFPAEADFKGDRATLMTAECKPIAEVPRGFADAVCVQGSGRLARGQTVSFARRDCPCADVCPRTGQRICFEALDAETFPWGRGASGRPIVPLRSVAVDTSVVPFGTPIYLAAFDGVPLEEGSRELHDGCFVADDRGGSVKGRHVDVFTGTPEDTRYWNALVPSNRGVDVMLDVAKCEFLRKN